MLWDGVSELRYIWGIKHKSLSLTVLALFFQCQLSNRTLWESVSHHPWTSPHVTLPHSFKKTKQLYSFWTWSNTMSVSGCSKTECLDWEKKTNIKHPSHWSNASLCEFHTMSAVEGPQAKRFSVLTPAFDRCHGSAAPRLPTPPALRRDRQKVARGGGMCEDS